MDVAMWYMVQSFMVCHKVEDVTWCEAMWYMVQVSPQHGINNSSDLIETWNWQPPSSYNNQSISNSATNQGLPNKDQCIKHRKDIFFSFPIIFSEGYLTK